MYLFHRHIDLASELKKAVGLAVGAAIYSAGLNLFLIPNHIIDGGITGISLLVQALTGIPFSVLIVLLNLPFFYIGYRRLGARLALSSTFAIVILSLCSSYFETMKPATSDPFLSTIFGGIIIGMVSASSSRAAARQMARRSWRSGWIINFPSPWARSSCFLISSSLVRPASSSAGTVRCIPSSPTSSARA